MPGSVIADRRDQLAGADAGQPALLLLVVGEVQEVRQADVVVQREAEPGGVDVGPLQLLGDDDVEAEVLDAAPAELLGHLHAEEAVGAGDGEQPAVDDPVGLPPLEVGHGLALEERPEGGAELLVGVVEQGAVHGGHHGERPDPGGAAGARPASARAPDDHRRHRLAAGVVPAMTEGTALTGASSPTTT